MAELERFPGGSQGKGRMRPEAAMIAAGNKPAG